MKSAVRCCARDVVDDDLALVVPECLNIVLIEDAKTTETKEQRIEKTVNWRRKICRKNNKRRL